MATQLGKPAINDPRGFTLRDVQQVIGNIRERFKTLDAVVATLATASQQAGQGVANDLAALQRQLGNLQLAIAALVALVEAMDPGSADTDPRTEQLAGELMQIRLDIEDIVAPPSAEGGDPVQEPVHAALLQGLQEQIDDINRSVLV